MRNMRSMLGVILFIFGCGIPCNAQGRDPVGFFMQVDGQVQVRRQASVSAARLADFLYSGDRIIVGLGRATFLFCPSSEAIIVRDDSTIDIAARNLQVVQGAPIRQKEDRCPLLRFELGSETVERIGGFRARTSPAVTLYLGGKIAASRPVFAWAPVPDAQTYRLTLRDEAGTVLWQETTSASSKAPYPNSQPPLRAGAYEWELRALAGVKTLAEQQAAFEVRPSDIMPLDAALIDAFALENADYYAEAAAVFREIRKSHPADDRIRRHLAWLYSRAGLIDAATDEVKALNSQPK